MMPNRKLFLKQWTKSTEQLCRLIIFYLRGIFYISISFLRHDVAEVAGLPAFSLGTEGLDRHIQVYKKETVPSDKVVEESRRTGITDLDEVKKVMEEVSFCSVKSGLK